jgi:hypothetical protein
VATYARIAAQIVVASYELTSSEALTIPELLEVCGLDDASEQVLVDSEGQRLQKLERLTVAIRHELGGCIERRIEAPLRESDIVSGSFVPALSDDVRLPIDVRDRKARLRLTRVLREILQELTPNEFESVCGLLMRDVGCRGITITPSQKDDGVDFTAELPISAAYSLGDGELPLFHRLMGAISFLVFGQAKRYADGNPVGQEAVVELEGAWSAIRNELTDGTIHDDRREALHRADYRAADPVLLLIATTSTLTAGAKKKAASLGVLALDGDQVAQMLLEREIGVEQVGPGDFVTSADLLRRAL